MTVFVFNRLMSRSYVFFSLLGQLYNSGFVIGSTLIQPRGNCSLPPEWEGRWARGDLDDAAKKITINHHSIFIENVELPCIESLEDFYVFSEIDETGLCYKCFMIMERHINVLQYRQGECHDEPSTEICTSISTDEPFLSLFRAGAVRESCPFGDKPLKFSYSTGNGICSGEESGSHLDTCSDSSMIYFNYEACVDVKGTEQFKEEVVCMGSWKESGLNFFVAKVIRLNQNHKHQGEGYRCFNYIPRCTNMSCSSVIGYLASRSGDVGSCTHAASPEIGSWTYNFTFAEEERRCSFPHWLELDGTHWSSMNLTFQFVVDASGGNIQMVHQPTRIQPNTTKLSTYQYTCSKIYNVTEDFASIQANQIIGCRRNPICMDFHKRTENIIEIEMHKRIAESGQLTSCNHQNDIIPHLMYTMVKENSSPIQCPLIGVYGVNVHTSSTNRRRGIDNCIYTSNETHPGVLSTLEIGCGGTLDGIDFYSTCFDTHDEKIITRLSLMSSLQCIAFWSEESKLYVVANNTYLGVPGHRCFEFVQNGSKSQAVFVSLNDCKPSTNQEFIEWNFNITLRSACGHFAHVQEVQEQHLSSSASQLPLDSPSSFIYSLLYSIILILRN